MLDDERGDRVVPGGELVQGNRLAALEAAKDVVAPHELTDVDVVARVDRRERRRHREPAAGEHFRLRGGLAARADALLLAGDDHLEVAAAERVALEQPLAAEGEPGVGVSRQLLRIVVEADPRRRHRVGVDVVEEILRRDVIRGEVDLAGELLADELGVPGEKQDPLARGE